MRQWTIAYAPSTKNNMRRLQEMHLLNHEMLYMYGNALWKRMFVMVFLFFFTTRIRKSLMKKYNNDSHDAHWRDTAGHM